MSDILAQVKNPISLIGLALLLLFSVHHALIRSGIIPPLDRRTGGRLSFAILRYGFFICVLLILSGVALTALNLVPNPLAKSFVRQIDSDKDVVDLINFFQHPPGKSST